MKHKISKVSQSEIQAYMLPKYAIIGSDNGLAPVRHQAIILTNAGLLSIGWLRIWKCCLQIGSHFVLALMY